MTRKESPYDVADIIEIFANAKLSAHYLIDRQGRIYQLVREDRAAFHAGVGRLPWPPFHHNTLNESSIGIELMGIGTREEMLPFLSARDYESLDPALIGFTDDQYEALKALTNEICRRWPSIKKDARHIVGHDLYARGRRTDPGMLFDWSRLGITRAEKP